MIALAGLFLTGLLASTLLPLASEPVLVGYLLYSSPPPKAWPAVLAMGLGNTGGALVTFAMGYGLRWLWQRRQTQSGKTPTRKVSKRIEGFVRRYGPFSLLFSWLPVVGDPLVLVAGTLRLAVWPCVFWIAVGKFGRYATVAWLTVS